MPPDAPSLASLRHPASPIGRHCCCLLCLEPPLPLLWSRHNWVAWRPAHPQRPALCAAPTADAYSDPGSPASRRTQWGTYVLALVEGERKLLMQGSGASPEGNRWGLACGCAGAGWAGLGWAGLGDAQGRQGRYAAGGGSHADPATAAARLHQRRPPPVQPSPSPPAPYPRRPFLDLLDVDSKEARRIWQSQPPHYEYTSSILSDMDDSRPVSLVGAWRLGGGGRVGPWPAGGGCEGVNSRRAKGARCLWALCLDGSPGDDAAPRAAARPRGAAPLASCPLPFLPFPPPQDNLRVLASRESVTEPPQFYIKTFTAGGAQHSERCISAFPHPYPSLRHLQKDIIRYKRSDGLELNGTLYLPPGVGGGWAGRGCHVGGLPGVPAHLPAA